MSDAIFDETLIPPSSAQNAESTSTKVEAIYVAAIGFSSRRSCHEVTDEVKSHGLPAAVWAHQSIPQKTV